MASNADVDGSPEVVKTVETSFTVLEELERRESAGVTELAEALGVSKSAVHRHLTTLAEHGRVVHRDGRYHAVGAETEAVTVVCEVVDALKEAGTATPETVADAIDRPVPVVEVYLDRLVDQRYVVEESGAYRNGLKFLDVGERVKYDTGVFDLIETEVDKLAEESGELALFSVEEHGQNVILYKSHGEQAIQTAHETGLREPLHCSALGKSILSQLADDRVETVLGRGDLVSFTENTITDREVLHEELEAVRSQGYAVDMEEAKPGMRCVAAPVTVGDGRLHGAVSVAAPKSRMTGDRFEHEMPELVKGAANVIEVNAIYVE